MTDHPQTAPALSPLKRAFLAIEELQDKLAAARAAAVEPIAIIGLGCRLPGDIETPAAFWELLRTGRDAVAEVPASRWALAEFYDANPATPGKMAARHGGFLRDIEGFDPACFGLSPREAASMDPQHRLLAEVAWEALSAAGQRRDRLAASPTGVFIGITTAEHGQLQLAAEGLRALDAYHITGNALNAAAGRLAFLFGLHGPCLAVDTACSSSLVALHLACQSLRAGECETALAGGVNLILSPIGSIALSQGRVLSPTGRTRAFDAGADGMVRGEGCGLLVLKRLSAAQRDGDRVLAVVRGSGVNQDGPSSGLTVPNGPAQEALLRRVLASAGVEPAAVDYVEAHGTGTPLGDPIEVGAIGAVYGAGRDAAHPLRLGSVKTNLGHLESAAGIAGVIKAVLALHHEAVPPHLHFTRPSPHIDWANLPLRVPTSLEPWPRGPRPRYAAVSAFGFSGTNAHVLLAEAPVAGAADDPRGLVPPPSPFRRERFPVPRPASLGGLADTPASGPLLGRELSLAGTDERRFETSLAPYEPGWLADHRVFTDVVVPASVWLELAAAAGRAVFGSAAVAVTEVVIEQALLLPAGEARRLQVVVRPAESGRWRVEMHARGAEGWARHAAAMLARGGVGAGGPDLAAARTRCTEARAVEPLYEAYAARGLAYGPAFRGVRQLFVGAGEAVAELALPEGLSTDGHAVHPALLDAGFQAAGAIFGDSDEVFLPVRAARWEVRAPVGARAWVLARARREGDGAVVDLDLFDETGVSLARLEGLVLQRATREALRRALGAGEDWLHEVVWREKPVEAVRPGLSGDWLVVGDRDGVGAELRGAGATVTAVDAAALASTLAARPAWTGVVYLAALDLPSEAAPTCAELGLAPLLTLARSLTKAEGVWIFTRGAVELGGADLSPAAAALAGLGRVLMQEHPDWSLRLVDTDAGALAPVVVRECRTGDRETQTVWRQGRRHAARLRRLVSAEEPAEPVLRADATYLITGGLGALGLLTAGWLVERGARHVVLAGRRPPGVEASAVIARWTDAGVRVETRTVDLARREEVAALLAGLPGLRGIVHAAGVIADGAASRLTPEQIDRVLAPKAAGARHLLELAGGLDFFVHYSSTAAVLGTPGQGNYAAANAYADALAARARAAGRPVTAINWGGWSAGLAATVDLGERGIAPITPKRGLRELGRRLAAAPGQTLVLPVRWSRFIATLTGGVPPLLTELAVPSATAAPDALATFRANYAAAPAAARPDLLAGLVRTEVARVLRLAPERLGATQPFSSLGFDSIMAVDLRNRLRLATDVDVPLGLLLSDGTVDGLVRVLGERSAPVEVPVAPVAEAGDEFSFGQEALWFLHLAAPASPAYNTAIALRLRGPVAVARLRAAVEALVARHPALRATVAVDAARPRWRVAAAAPADWREIDAAGWDAARLEREVAAEYARPFALQGGPVFRAAWFQAGPADGVLLLGLHHIAGDAWTNWILLDELRRLLAGADLPPVGGTYADFVRWQRATLAGAEGERLWAHWREALAGELTPLALPTDFPRPAVLVPEGASVPLALPAPTWAAVRAIARAQGTTPFTVLLAAFQVLLHRYSGQEDIVVGSPTAGRSRPEFARVAGYFVNPVPLRARIDGRAAFTDLLATVKRTVLDALSQADLPLPLLIERLKLPRDPARSPLFQTLFVFQKPPAEHAEGAAGAAWGEVGVEEFPLAQMEGQFELTLELFEDRGGHLKYNRTLFTAATAERLARSFRTLLEALVANPSARIADLPLLDAAERRQVLTAWNAPPADYPQEFCLHELIAAQVARTPAAPALTAGEITLSYRELDERANQLAHWLRRAGVGPDRLVGVCAERSLELVVALLGILKAGGAYVPLDPGYPRERLGFMLADSGVALVLTQAHLAAGAASAGVRLLALDADWSEVAREPGTAPATGAAPDHLAYMIYTSGSTGRPKGAMNSHRAIVNRLLWMQDAYRLTAADTVVQKTPFSFDVSVWEFFWPLLAGARLVMAKPGGHQDAAYLADLVARERVTTMHFVPSMLQVFVGEPGLDRCTALRQVFCSGEALPADLAQRFLARHPAELHNLYGPTEAAVDVTYWRCVRGDDRASVPIGHPIARTSVHVLDARMQPVPVGVAGELYLGGIGLARGYHGRPELTAEKFVPDPFGPPGGRLYRTGDLARRLPGGEIDYLGRLDHQVKLRGFRIELGEIEAALTRQPGVREAVVVVREVLPGEKSLVAYVVPEAGAAPVAAAWRAALRAELPDYMVPGDFVVLAALPLSPNGKLDRRALPAPRRDEAPAGARFVAPETPTERLLAGLWAEALGRERVGVEDNFFDLGGHSLKLGQVHAGLRVHFPAAPGLLELFQYPTIRGLAARLDRGPGPVAAAAEPAAPRRAGLADQRSLRRAAREPKAAR